MKKSKRPLGLEDGGKLLPLRLGSGGLPVLDQFSEEGFVDSVFKIVNLRRVRGHYRFHLGASFGSAEVGLDCRVLRGIEPGFDAEMGLSESHVYRDAIEFSRSGPESDRFVRSMVKRYGSRKRSAKMVASVSFTGIALHQGELDVEREPVKIKLFGFDWPEDEPAKYNESFFNLDLSNRLVFWNEKDQEYRAALLSALTGS